MNTHATSKLLAVTCIALLALPTTARAQAAIRTVLVSPQPGDPAGSGKNLLNALDAIADSSCADRYLIKLEPGTYDVGGDSVIMKECVDIEGSGQGITLIRGDGNDPAAGQLRGIVEGADNAELRDLSVTAVPTAGSAALIPIRISRTSPSLTRVTSYVEGEGSAGCWGILNHGGSPTIRDVTVRVTCTGGSSSGISNWGFVYGAPTFERVSIVVRKATANHGIVFTELMRAALLRDLRVHVGDGDRNYGLYIVPDEAGATFTLTGSSIDASVGSGSKYGIYMEGLETDLVVEHSQIKALGGGTKTGIAAFSFGTVEVRNSIVWGAQNTIRANGAVRIGATQLAGGPVAASVATCAGVYDASFEPYNGACP